MVGARRPSAPVTSANTASPRLRRSVFESSEKLVMYVSSAAVVVVIADRESHAGLLASFFVHGETRRGSRPPRTRPLPLLR